MYKISVWLRKWRLFLRFYWPRTQWASPSHLSELSFQKISCAAALTFPAPRTKPFVLAAVRARNAQREAATPKYFGRRRRRRPLSGNHITLSLRGSFLFMCSVVSRVCADLLCSTKDVFLLLRRLIIGECIGLRSGGVDNGRSRPKTEQGGYIIIRAFL